MSEQQKQTLLAAFESIFERQENDEENVSRYFSKDYTQWVDGHELDFQGFIEHLQSQRKRIQSVSFQFKNIISEGDKVSTIHLVDALTTEGNSVQGKVIAHFTFKDGKIIHCEELTYFANASEKDRDLGSVR